MLEMLNKYHSGMNAVVEKYEGVLDKFMGDGIMAVFLPQDEQDNHALRAVRCAVDMQREIGRLDQEWIAHGMGHLNVRVGINSGEVISGKYRSRNKDGLYGDRRYRERRLKARE